MAKYNVKFSCGHTEIMQLGGKIEDRYKKIEYFEENGLCKECYSAKMNRQIVMESEGLPVLEGSEKQITWAMKIRLEKIEITQTDMNILVPPKYQTQLNEEFYREGLDGYLQKIKCNIPIEKQDEMINMFKKYHNLLENMIEIKTTTSAKWIIDNRL